MNWKKRKFYPFIQHLFVELLLCPGTELCIEDTLIASFLERAEQSVGETQTEGPHCNLYAVVEIETVMMSIGNKVTDLEWYPVSNFRCLSLK